MVDVVAVVGSGLMVFLCVCVCGSVDGSVWWPLLALV